MRFHKSFLEYIGYTFDIKSPLIQREVTQQQKENEVKGGKLYCLKTGLWHFDYLGVTIFERLQIQESF